MSHADLAPRPDNPWDRLARLRVAAPRHAARARKATYALVALAAVLVPLWCSTWSSGDYGPRPSGETAEVGQVALVAIGLALVVNVALRALAVVAAARGLLLLLRLSSSGEVVAPDVAAAARDHRAKVQHELGDGVLVPSLVWLGLGVAAVGRVALALVARP